MTVTTQSAPTASAPRTFAAAAAPDASAPATPTAHPVESAGLLPKDNPNARTQALGLTTPQAGKTATAVATPTATALPAPCDVTRSNLYCVYTVQAGDTLSTIANRFGLKSGDVSASQLLAESNRPDIVDDDSLNIGEQLRVPTQNGVLHTVLSAETLGDIADTYDVASADIMAIQINNITNPNSLAIGQDIIVPNPKQFAKPAPPPPTPAPVTAAASSGSGSSGSSSSNSSGSGSSAPAAQAPASIAKGPSSSYGLIWPAKGPISSYFGPSHPLGIDIDFYADPNQPVGAAAAGTVTFAGGDPCCSYGYYVVLDNGTVNGNSLGTLYGHFSKILVSQGQHVSQGQVLGLGGRTGNATGNHLHFEVHINGQVVDPLQYLP